jgi:hypothetical protein
VKTIAAKRGRIEIKTTDGVNVNIALAQDDGRIYKRPGAGWVDLTLEQAKDLRAALDELLEGGES